MNVCVIADGRKCWSVGATVPFGESRKTIYMTHDGKLTEDKVAEFPIPTLHCIDYLELSQQYIGFNIISYNSIDKQWTGRSPDGFHVRIKKVDPQPSESRAEQYENEIKRLKAKLADKEKIEKELIRRITRVEKLMH
jgi:hypothetical protein